MSSEHGESGGEGGVARGCLNAIFSRRMAIALAVLALIETRGYNERQSHIHPYYQDQGLPRQIGGVAEYALDDIKDGAKGTWNLTKSCVREVWKRISK
ncbi:hypothetical protein KA057_01080 [Candidatus Gracilibacteria bacterium]|nr:hypothetical protein [Candidatus Gracilibacteria bacterium]